MRRSGVIFRIVILWLVAQTAFGQSDRITGEFKGLSFSQFATELEQKTPYRFYFHPALLDSLEVTISVTNNSIDEVLNRIFDGTQFRFAIDAYQNIYITRLVPIMTELPPGFFDGEAIASDAILESSERSGLLQEKTTQTDKVFVIGAKGSGSRPTASVAGYVKNINSAEPLIGASVMIENPLTGVITDVNGYYSITLPKGAHQLKIRSMGMKEASRNILLQGDGTLTIELEEDVLPLKAVIVESTRDERVTGLQMGLEKIDLSTLKQLPMVLGEVDIIKAVLTLPGVQTVGEGTVGFNVRGGATDQNLVAFNDATIYNPSHLFGFFSAINSDLIKNAELYKSGIPAEYGGRISSVLDIITREGNKKKWTGSGGISPVTGRLAAEGPLVKDKSSLLLGGRFSYSDWLLKELPNSNLENSEASFYDANVILNHEFSAKNSLHISGYLSKDRFKLQQDTVYNYANQALSASWKHIFNNKLLGEFGTSFSAYDYAITSQANPVLAFDLDYAIRQWQSRADLTYFMNSRHTFTFGAGVINYKLQPGKLSPLGDESLIIPDRVPAEQALESAFYFGDTFEINPRLSLYGGLRYSWFVSRGPDDVFIYQPGTPKDETTIIDTVSYASGEKVASYGGLEPRVSLRYSLSRNTSVKFSYNRMRQYIQMLSNTTAIAPTDIWKLSDTYIKPVIGDQLAIGYYHNLNNKPIEISVEAYWKLIHNVLDYKGGAELILNQHIETDVINADGRAYGVEFMIKKTRGKFNGWFTYTYSRSLLRAKGESDAETINRGEYYPSNYDKPHAVNLITNYKFSRRFSVSTNVVYSTGRPITLPVSKYILEGTERLLYSDRNQYRIPDYFRVDVSIFMEGNHKTDKLVHGSWSLSVYNVLGRRNAYSVYFNSENGTVQGYRLSIFGNAIPTLTYNFKF